MAHYERALASKPDLFDTRNRLALILMKQGRLEDASVHFERAIQLAPGFAEAYGHLGRILWQQGKIDQATARMQQAVALHPIAPNPITTWGAQSAHQGKIAGATAHFEQAIALAPDNAHAHYNLGKVLLSQDELDQALARFKRAVVLRPDIAEMQYAVATRHLLAEDYQQGWPLFEWRLKMPGAGTEPNLPRWNGEPLAGRSLLLVAEQGYGDTFHFVPLRPAVQGPGARVVLAVQPALGPLLQSYPDADELCLISDDAEPPLCDFYLWLLSARACWAQLPRRSHERFPILRPIPS